MRMNGNLRHLARTFGSFAGASPELFPGGPAFIGGDDAGVFYGANTGFTAGAKNQGYDWEPADPALATKAGNKWAELSGPDISDADMTFKDAMKRKFNTLLNSFYGAVGAHSMLGYSPDATQNIISIGNQLKTALRDLIRYKLQPDVQVVTGGPTPESNAALQAQLDAARQQAKLQKELAEQRAAAGATTPTPPPAVQQYNPPASNMQALAMGGATDDQPAWILPAAIAGGVLVVGGLIFALTRSKKSPGMAGYRRRRIRR